MNNNNIETKKNILEELKKINIAPSEKVGICKICKMSHKLCLCNSMPLGGVR